MYTRISEEHSLSFFIEKENAKMILSSKEIDWLVSMYKDVIVLNSYRQEYNISSEQAERRIEELIAYKALLLLNDL